ncbi:MULTISPECIES: CGNR zinc finger domain-containing protein [unclassified Pseudomonas]|uniref:CGNR zinc finger domain-containing protein n=1 Tax=unclassified Pseudomonas TaxID=196821 RepID=UPI00384C6ED5
MTSPDRLRLKACATPDCDWLFLDTSKNGRRRWCQMNVCGQGKRPGVQRAVSIDARAPSVARVARQPKKAGTCPDLKLHISCPERSWHRP